MPFLSLSLSFCLSLFLRVLSLVPDSSDPEAREALSLLSRTCGLGDKGLVSPARRSKFALKRMTLVTAIPPPCYNMTARRGLLFCTHGQLYSYTNTYLPVRPQGRRDRLGYVPRFYFCTW
ncbi:hypothetical protein LX36DRAFT_654629 [Colletotrichum falcatum]|nr:hypothetical protein LX36DRAFT_654629 [Colletotrichum falcatum]